MGNGVPWADDERDVKRDWNIIRAVLLKLEDAPTPNTAVTARDFPEFDEQAVAYNIRLMKQAGLAHAIVKESHQGDGLIGLAIANSMTPVGHELLDTIRNDTVWARIQERFRSQGLEMTVDLVLKVGKRVLAELLGL